MFQIWLSLMANVIFQPSEKEGMQRNPKKIEKFRKIRIDRFCIISYNYKRSHYFTFIYLNRYIYHKIMIREVSGLGRLSLVMADGDRDYLARFERFLIVNYPQRFEVFSFSSSDTLLDFLNNHDKKDILLINRKIYRKELRFIGVDSVTGANSVIFLSGDGGEVVPEGFDVIDKYQHAEKIVAEILRLYSSGCAKDCHVSGSNHTHLVCIYSPAGGTGTSSIAAGCSILSAGRGLKTFYLNLENVPSTGRYFNGETEQSFSNVIYYLKGKGHNLGLKLESAKCCDSKNGVYFYAPPASVLDMSELTEQDIVHMLDEFKKGAIYDAVFIDLPSGLNPHNTAVLGHSDAIILVLGQGESTTLKMNQVKAGIELLEQKHGIEILGKITPVINKWNKGDLWNDAAAYFCGTPARTIEKYSVMGSDCLDQRLDENRTFLFEVNELLEQILPKGAANSTAYNGGEFIA